MGLPVQNFLPRSINLNTCNKFLFENAVTFSDFVMGSTIQVSFIKKKTNTILIVCFIYSLNIFYSV